MISPFYYFRIVKALFLRFPEDAPVPAKAGLSAPAQGLVVTVLFLLGIATLYYGVYWEALDSLTRLAAP